MADTARVREALRLHRREGDAFVADLEGLGAEEWETPTNCAPWTVRQLAAHVARQVESYIGNVEPGLRGQRAEPESREVRTQRAMEIAGWESSAILDMLRTTNEQFNRWFGALSPEQLDVTGPHSHGPRTAAWFVDQRLAEMAFHRMDLEQSLGRDADLDQRTARFLLPMLLELNVPAIVARDKTGGEGTYALAVRGEPGAVWRLAFRPGGLDVTPGAGEADVTFEADPAAMARMMYGRDTWQDLEREGRLTVRGNREAGERFHTLFKGP